MEQRLGELNQALSTYLPDSEISRINRGSEQTMFSLGPLLQKALRLSFQVFRESGGFFDPSVGPLVNLWGHGPQKHRRPPNQQTIARTLPLVGLDKYQLSRDFTQLRKPHRDAYLDFSASGKGLGVDEVALTLESMGIGKYMVEIGGEIRVRSNGKKIWNLAIERPLTNGESAIQTTLPMNTGSLATSGNYRNYYTEGGKHYGHTIDPHNGETSPDDLLSATVIHDNCTLADAWATALMAMGRHKAIATAEQRNLKAFFVVATKEGPKELSSSSWPNPPKRPL